MLEFLKNQREQGNLADEQLNLFLNVFINQEEYEMLKAIEPKK